MSAASQLGVVGCSALSLPACRPINHTPKSKPTMDSTTNLHPPHTFQTWSSRSSTSDETLCDDDNHSMSEKMSPKMGDVEAQPILSAHGGKEPQSPSSLAMEYRVPARTKLMYLGGYFLLNLSLTLYNKALLGNVSFRDFYIATRSPLTTMRSSTSPGC